jgi:hypothetical protein
MIKKGLDLLHPTIDWNVEYRCCNVCIFPLRWLCRLICKFRKATLKEAIEYREERGRKYDGR